MRHAEGVRQHGAKRSAAPKRQRSPQHADPSAARDTPKKRISTLAL
ncbi:MAG: hypothetical protein NZ455_09385 [Bacteroidia bacterium]|nr:hypothetical protein [Bacteroidia bacterium]